MFECGEERECACLRVFLRVIFASAPEDEEDR